MPLQVERWCEPAKQWVELPPVPDDAGHVALMDTRVLNDQVDITWYTYGVLAGQGVVRQMVESEVMDDKGEPVYPVRYEIGHKPVLELCPGGLPQELKVRDGSKRAVRRYRFMFVDAA